MKKLFLFLSILALGLAVYTPAQAASVTLGWGQDGLVIGDTTFYGWKVWSSTSQNGTYTQFGSDIVWDGTIKTEYTSPAIPITPPAGQQTTYYFKLDAWNKPGTSTSLHSDFSNIVSATFDLKAPTVPVITPAIPATTTATSITLAGTKEANSSIWINGAEKMALTSGTTWSISMPLALGANSFSITSKDAAGNTSAAVVVSITRNPVATAPPVPKNFRVIVTAP